jgi:predicted SprT family Zn-dependent metalloprotease
MATKTRKSTKGRAETIATCGPCQRTYIMCGTPGQLRRERALRCGRCKGPLQIMAEVERQR